MIYFPPVIIETIIAVDIQTIPQPHYKPHSVENNNPL